jgi:hypothetical protein
MDRLVNEKIIVRYTATQTKDDVVGLPTKVVLLGSMDTIICIDTPYTMHLLHATTFRVSSFFNIILHLTSARLLFFLTLTNDFKWEYFF